MSKLTTKISIPIILAGVFAITIFIALDHDRLDTAFYIVLLILTVFVFLFGFATGQEFASPIKKLLERAIELSNGNLSSRVYLETKDELAELAKVFNKIAEELESSQVRQEKTEQSVGVKVKAKTQELEETINALEQKVKNRTAELERLVKEADKSRSDIKDKELEASKLREELLGLKQKYTRGGKTKVVPNTTSDKV